MISETIQNYKVQLYAKKVLYTVMSLDAAHIFTFAGAIRSSQHSTLIYAAEGLKQPFDVLVALLLSQHAHKQLSIL